MSQVYVRYLLHDQEELCRITDPHVVMMDLQADFDKIGPYYLQLGVYDMTSDPFPEYVQAMGYLKDGQLCGFLMIMHLEDDGTWEIAAVSVSPHMRGMGIGKALVSYAAEWVLNMGKTASLTTKIDNHAMRQVAAHIGMQCAD